MNPESINRMDNTEQSENDNSEWDSLNENTDETAERKEELKSIKFLKKLGAISLAAFSINLTNPTQVESHTELYHAEHNRDESNDKQRQVDLKKDVETVRDSLESQLNNRLLKVKDLETAVKNGDSNVKYEKTENGADVYTISYPYNFAVMLHDINYRDPNDKLNNNGSAIQQKLIEDPSIWEKTYDELAAEGYTTTNDENKNNISNTLSTFYFSSDSIGSVGFADNRSSSQRLIYGFSDVASESLIYITNGDAKTLHNTTKSGDVTIDARFLGRDSEKEILRKIDSNPDFAYSEAAFYRYDDNGNPNYEPDFIYTTTLPNGKANISEAMEKHAIHFGIPIINIDLGSYTKIDDKLIEDAKTMDYPELNKVINRIGLNGERINTCGDGLEEYFIQKSSENRSERGELVRIEFEKRLDVYEQTLKRFIALYDAGIAGGYRPIWTPDPKDKMNDILQHFSVGINDSGDAPKSIEMYFDGSESHRGIKIVDGTDIDWDSPNYKYSPQIRKESATNKYYDRFIGLAREFVEKYDRVKSLPPKRDALSDKYYMDAVTSYALENDRDIGINP